MSPASTTPKLTARQQFDALPTSAQDNILGKHRRYWEPNDWWDDIYYPFRIDMADIGIRVDEVYFSGFASQGDGALFEGAVENWPLFLASLGHTNAALVDLAERRWTFQVKSHGRYCHENATYFSTDLWLPDWTDNGAGNEEFVAECSPYDTEIQNAVWLAQLCDYDSEKMEGEFIEAFKDHMRSLYRQLEAEYEHITSDEAILESLDANDELQEAVDKYKEEEEEEEA